jgi:hypothetical protein
MREAVELRVTVEVYEAAGCEEELIEKPLIWRETSTAFRQHHAQTINEPAVVGPRRLLVSVETFREEGMGGIQIAVW